LNPGKLTVDSNGELIFGFQISQVRIEHLVISIGFLGHTNSEVASGYTLTIGTKYSDKQAALEEPIQVETLK
jgi:hypothetical protein